MANPTQTPRKRFTTDKPSMSDILRERKPAERAVYICVDPGLVVTYEEIEGRIKLLEHQAMMKRGKSSLAEGDSHEIMDLRDQLRELDNEIEEISVKFLARDIGRKNYDKLLTAFPANEEEKKDWKDSGMLAREGPLSWGQDFIAPLIAACYVEPAISIEEANELVDAWGQGEVTKLFTNCLMVCTEVTTIPKFKVGTRQTPDTDLNSTTALAGISPTPDS